ncbi:MAG TPA: transcriptional regulator [Desulfovibrio sp.]|jgi:hypothetical protein|uniref:phage regulatory CII family protein n=1 Tax=Desulfovibrio TaxID=872 RepID=UPI00041B6B8D|nr:MULTISPECIES: phage regulatory CII family protein [Desulfovibrio]MDY0307379.1 transcriptional regulator [Desulfovibrionaceae bacterium]HMM38998.1 transcriptional regulator [Desulfovibrio sp.]
MRPTFPSLAAVLHQLVKRAPSGLRAETIADMLGKPYATLMSELSSQPGHKLGADLVLPLMEAAGSDAALHFLAREMGGAFVRLPEAAPGVEPVQRQCLVAVKEFGELVARTAGGLADGELSERDRRDILREGHEAVTAIMALLRQVESGDGR